jgi:hypothetical protein
LGSDSQSLGRNAKGLAAEHGVLYLAHEGFYFGDGASAARGTGAAGTLDDALDAVLQDGHSFREEL